MRGIRAPLGRERALEAVSQAVAQCPADAVEATVTGRAGEYTRFAGDRIHQPQDITELSIAVKAVVDGHAVRTATTSLSDLHRVVVLAAELARQRAREAPGPGGTTVAARDADTSSRPPRLWHEDTVGFDAGRRVALARQAMGAAEAAGGHCTGMIGRAVSEIAVATSAGVARHAEATEAHGALTVTVEDGTAHWVDVGRSSDALGVEDRIDEAVARARRGRGRVPMPDGELTVVLGPEAAGELVGFLGELGLSGALAAAGVGVWAGRRGQQVAARQVTVRDDALAEVGLPIGFDMEGTTKQTVPLLEAGVVGEPVTDLTSAARLGRRSTGHAHVAREEVPSAVAANVVVEPGTTGEDDLVGGVERGVYVERFWYTRLVDRQASTITGVSRDACFLIEDGVLTRPVGTGRFTQSVLGFLDTVDGVGDRLVSQPVMNVWNGCVSAPALRGHGFRFGDRPDNGGSR